MFASIACAAMLLTGFRQSGNSIASSVYDIEAISRDTFVDPGRLHLIFAHQSECDLCQFVRSTPWSDFSAAPHPNGGPSRIILMRHADKPDDPDDPDLSAAGVVKGRASRHLYPSDIWQARLHNRDGPLETLRSAVGNRRTTGPGGGRDGSARHPR